MENRTLRDDQSQLLGRDVRFIRDFYIGERLFVHAGAEAEVMAVLDTSGDIIVTIHEEHQRATQPLPCVLVPLDAVSIIRTRSSGPSVTPESTRRDSFRSPYDLLAALIPERPTITIFREHQRPTTGQEGRELTPNGIDTREDGIEFPDPRYNLRSREQELAFQRALASLASVNPRRVQRDLVPTLRSEMATMGSNSNQAAQQDQDLRQQPESVTDNGEITGHYSTRIVPIMNGSSSPAGSPRQHGEDQSEEQSRVPMNSPAPDGEQ